LIQKIGGQVYLLFNFIEHDYNYRYKRYKMKRKRILLVAIAAGMFFSCSDDNDIDQEFTRAYVTLQGSDKVAVIDVDHAELVAEIDVNFINTGDRPHYVVIDEIHRTWYVTLISSGYVCKFDLDTDELLDSVFVGSQPALMDINRESQILYVSRFMPMPSMGMEGTESQLVHKINAATMTILGTVDVGASSPHGIALSNDGSTLWVASNEASHFFAIETARFGESDYQPQNFRLGSDVPYNYEINDNTYNALELVLNQDGSELFVSCSGKGQVRVFDTSSGDSLKYYSTGMMPWHMAVSNDDKYLYTTNRMSNNVVQTDLTSGTTKTFTAEDLTMPHGVALTADNRKLVVSSSMGDVLYIVDAVFMVMTGMIVLVDGGMDMDNMHMPTGVAVVQD